MNETAKQRTKIEDVARAADVSIMSVSRAMRGVEGISNKKREEILRIARQMGYYPNRIAVSLAAASSNLIGVSVPTLFGTVFAEIYDGMRTKLEAAGFATVIEITDYSLDREDAWIERMISWRPAGLVLSGVNHNPATRERLKTARIPVLELWDYSENPIDLCVGIDHFNSGYEMGEHLCTLGYTSPAYIGVAAGTDFRADQRLAGLEEIFQQSGTSFAKQDRSSKIASFKSGFDATHNLLEADGPAPDVVCYLNDNMAFGGMMACERRGLKCPHDIGIVGYNGFEINSVLPKRMTTTITPRLDMGEKGAALLIAKMHGAKVQKSVSLKTRIDKGETTTFQQRLTSPNV